MLKRLPQGAGRQQSIIAVSGSMILAIALFLAGCGRSGTSRADASKNELAPPSAQGGATTAPSQAQKIAAPNVPEDAPVLSEVYPTLSGGALRLARLADLPGSMLLWAEGVSIAEEDLQRELAAVPAELRADMRKNAFFLLEQKATMELVTALAQRRFGNAAIPQDRLLQRYFEEVTRGVAVTDAEIETFYNENRGLVGPMPLKEIKPRIREHLRQQKQQEAVEAHLAELGKEIPIVLSAQWVQEQATLAMDNPVDKARSSGKPTFVNFGAKGCVPCDMMEPIREEIKREYEGRLNVVFVHVNKDRLLASRYRVRGIPHLVFFDKNGKEVHSHTGYLPKERIEEWLNKSGVSD